MRAKGPPNSPLTRIWADESRLTNAINDTELNSDFVYLCHIYGTRSNIPRCLVSVSMMIVPAIEFARLRHAGGIMPDADSIKV